MEDIRREIDKTLKPRKATLSAVSLDFGKVPPQALELEEAVLGAVMLEKQALSLVEDILKPDVFYKPNNATIFRAILSLHQKGNPIDILSVTNELKEQGDLEIIGGPYYIAQLTSRVGSAANIEFHARLLLEKYIKRELIRIGSNVITDAFEEGKDALELLAETEKQLFEAARIGVTRNNVGIGEIVQKVLQNAEAAARGEISTGIPSGFQELDKITYGWKQSNLIIIAARPGKGKTALVLTSAREMAVKYNVPVAIFSLEMEAIELGERLVSSEVSIHAHAIKTGQLSDSDWQILNNNLVKLSSSNIFINDTPALSIFEFRTLARRLVHSQKVGAIIVDYLQLMKGDTSSKQIREQEVSLISRTLKATAKELQVPIIALSQLNRKTEDSNRRPQLADLRESGAIEQDADLVIFIWENDEETKLVVAKNRHGSTGDVDIVFNKQYTRFENPKPAFGDVRDFSQKMPRGGEEDTPF